MLMRDSETLLELRDRARDVAFVKKDNGHCIVESYGSGWIDRLVCKVQRALDIACDFVD
jgi:hypothetical protein